jgi:hypothetical protein
MRQIIKNQVLNNLLIKRGYIQQPLLSESEVAYLLEETKKAFPESRFNLQQDDFSQSYVTNSYTDKSEDVRAIGPKVIQHILAPRIEELFDNYRILYCGLFVKAPMGGWLDIHYHPTVVEDPKQVDDREPTINWVGLDAVFGVKEFGSIHFPLLQ